MKLKMSIEEAFVACTYNAAKSLQLEDSIGSISIGKADLIIWDIETLEEIPYYFMDAPIQKIKNVKSHLRLDYQHSLLVKLHYNY